MLLPDGGHLIEQVEIHLFVTKHYPGCIMRNISHIVRFAYLDMIARCRNIKRDTLSILKDKIQRQIESIPVIS